MLAARIPPPRASAAAASPPACAPEGNNRKNREKHLDADEGERDAVNDLVEPQDVDLERNHVSMEDNGGHGQTQAQERRPDELHLVSARS